MARNTTASFRRTLFVLSALAGFFSQGRAGEYYCGIGINGGAQQKKTCLIFDGRDNAVRETTYTPASAEVVRRAGRKFDTVVLDSVDHRTTVNTRLWLDRGTGIPVQTRLTGGRFSYLADACIIQSVRCAPPRSSATIESGSVTYHGRSYPLYPETLAALPDIPSPLTAADGTELVVATAWNGRYGIVPVTLKTKERQCDSDSTDFPTFAATGLHSEAELDRTRTITGRPVAEVSALGQPGRLSTDGFLSADEDILPVLKADNRIVKALGLTHPDLARPLFHILNMMNTDLDLGRWNMAEHRWHNITSVLSNGRTVKMVARDTKGGQLSIFADGIEGAFWIEIMGELTGPERAFLKTRYPELDAAQMDALVRALTRIRTGEIQPHYITWYGFYEGKTPWRTDPVTIAFIFGLRTLEAIESAFTGRLFDVMMTRFADR